MSSTQSKNYRKIWLDYQGGKCNGAGTGPRMAQKIENRMKITNTLYVQVGREIISILVTNGKSNTKMELLEVAMRNLKS